jgi:hypothetical protein
VPIRGTNVRLCRLNNENSRTKSQNVRGDSSGVFRVLDSRQRQPSKRAAVSIGARVLNTQRVEQEPTCQTASDFEGFGARKVGQKRWDQVQSNLGSNKNGLERRRGWESFEIVFRPFSDSYRSLLVSSDSVERFFVRSAALARGERPRGVTRRLSCAARMPPGNVTPRAAEGSQDSVRIRVPGEQPPPS